MPLIPRHSNNTKLILFTLFSKKLMTRKELSKMFAIPYSTTCWILRIEKQRELQSKLF
jgi:hypothetical protein